MGKGNSLFCKRHEKDPRQRSGSYCAADPDCRLTVSEGMKRSTLPLHRLLVKIRGLVALVAVCQFPLFSIFIGVSKNIATAWSEFVADDIGINAG